jgi:hypothetical protein
VVKPI